MVTSILFSLISGFADLWISCWLLEFLISVYQQNKSNTAVTSRLWECKKPGNCIVFCRFLCNITTKLECPLSYTHYPANCPLDLHYRGEWARTDWLRSVSRCCRYVLHTPKFLHDTDVKFVLIKHREPFVKKARFFVRPVRPLSTSPHSSHSREIVALSEEYTSACRALVQRFPVLKVTPVNGFIR